MKKLTRSRDDRWIGGVCGGVAEYTGLDATLVRLAVVVLTVLGFGSLILGYLVAWVIMPREPLAPVWAQATDVPPTTANGPAPQ